MRVPGAAAPPAGVWLVSFVDLLALLLTFFVLMFAMSRMPQDDVATVLSTLPGRIADGERHAGAGLVAAEPDRAPPALALDYLGHLVAARVAAEPELGGAAVRSDGDAVRLVLPRWDDGAAAALAPFLDRLGNRLLLVAHAPAAAVDGWGVGLRNAEAAAAGLRAAGLSRPLAVAAGAPSLAGRVVVELARERAAEAPR